MSRIIFMSSLLALSLIVASKQSLANDANLYKEHGKTIASINFKDEELKQCVLANAKKNGWLNIGQVTSLACPSRKIKDTSDISNFFALQILHLWGNNIFTIDVGQNTELTTLILMKCELKTINLSNNLMLTKLNILSNQLTSIDVSKNIALKDLELSINKLATIDLSKNTVLTTLSLNHNRLTVIDLSKNKLLKSVKLSGNSLKEINIDSNASLKYLELFNGSLTTQSKTYLKDIKNRHPQLKIKLLNRDGSTADL